MILLLRYLISVVIRFPALLVYKIYDLYIHIKHKKWKEFNGFGLTIYLGLFGKGKTCSAVREVYAYACKYPDLIILTNIELSNFPNPERIIPLTNPQQIAEAKNAIILIDEISSLFNSRNYKDNISPEMLTLLLQQRHQKVKMIGTAQRFGHLDKLLRDITNVVIPCNNIKNRLVTNEFYDAYEYENASITKRPRLRAYNVYMMTDRIRGLYDTMEYVEKLKKEKFVSNAEIMANRAGAEKEQVIVNAQAPQPRKGIKRLIFGR